jgi:hypothetical protein
LKDPYEILGVARVQLIPDLIDDLGVYAPALHARSRLRVDDATQC